MPLLTLPLFKCNEVFRRRATMLMNIKAKNCKMLMIIKAKNCKKTES
jgi:hypothetical protein